MINWKKSVMELMVMEDEGIPAIAIREISTYSKGT